MKFGSDLFFLDEHIVGSVSPQLVHGPGGLQADDSDFVF